MLPILERLLYKPKSTPVSRVLVLVPTRELAVQVHQVTKQLSQFTKVTAVLAAGDYINNGYSRTLEFLCYIVVTHIETWGIIHS